MMIQKMSRFACSMGMLAAVVCVDYVQGASLPVTSGLLVHLDGSSIVDDGNGNVIGWNDISGNGLNATGTGELVSGATPNGENAVSFDGSAQFLEIGASTLFDTASGDLTWIVVFKADLLANDRMVGFGYGDIDPDPGTTVLSASALESMSHASNGYRTSGREQNNDFDVANTPGTLSAGIYFIGISQLDSANDLMISSVTDAAGTTTTGDSSADADLSNLALNGHLYTRLAASGSGKTDTDPGNFFDGEIAEFIVYDRKLSVAEATSVGTHLYNKHIAIPEPASASVIALMGLMMLRRKNSV
ncbi:hypothetical protein [Poriferisphaera sp. WC338]|uniref:hypothetical protein n=1 Tax=Poriferisphaera sp. WC338 TaxID=3425129 RepID=UPI003D81BDFD